MLLLFVVATISIQTGCYHYRVVTPKPDPATDYERRTVHALFWGLGQPEDMETTDCLSNAIDEVRVTTNLGYALVAVATLGVWMPLEVEWRCAKEPSPNGEI